MSVYRDTNTEVTFEHPFPGPLVAHVYRNGTKILESEPLTPIANRYTLPLTFRETQYDGPLDIEWIGQDGSQTFLRTMTEQVITPLVPLTRLKTLFADTHWGDEELKELENTVRIFIESYTGQTFGYKIGTEYITGTGEKRAMLPRRLIRATTVDGGPPGQFSVSDDGWYIYLDHKNWLGTKEAPPEDYFYDSPTHMTKGVIHVPDAYWKKFRVGAVYTVTGEWGYYSVPDDIKEAALLLANDWGCGENIYRDRYLESVKYADSNMTFNQGAYRATGNARADQLLDPYRRQGIVII